MPSGGNICPMILDKCNKEGYQCSSTYNAIKFNFSMTKSCKSMTYNSLKIGLIWQKQTSWQVCILCIKIIKISGWKIHDFCHFLTNFMTFPGLEKKTKQTNKHFAWLFQAAGILGYDFSNALQCDFEIMFTTEWVDISFKSAKWAYLLGIPTLPVLCFFNLPQVGCRIQMEQPIPAEHSKSRVLMKKVSVVARWVGMRLFQQTSHKIWIKFNMAWIGNPCR